MAVYLEKTGKVLYEKNQRRIVSRDKKIKSFRDITTHSDLAKKRSKSTKQRLPSLIPIRLFGPMVERRKTLEDSLDKKIEEYLYKKNNNGNGNGAKKGFSFRDKTIFLKILHRLESDISELEDFAREGIPGATEELSKKEERLSRFQKYYFHQLQK